MGGWTKEVWHSVGAWIEVERDDIPDIANFDPAAMGQQNLPRSQAEIFANARLAADAPSMLALLVDISEHFSGAMPDDLYLRVNRILDDHE